MQRVEVPARVERDRRRRMVVVVFGILAAIAIPAGLGIALWSSDGSGSASAKALTAEDLTVTAAPSPTAALYPGASAALQFSVTNPNPYAVTFTSVAYGTVTSSDDSNCPASNLTPAADGALGTPISVAASGSSGAVSIPSAVTLASGAPNGCQGVTFTVAVTLSGSQS